MVHESWPDTGTNKRLRDGAFDRRLTGLIEFRHVAKAALERSKRRPLDHRRL